MIFTGACAFAVVLLWQYGLIHLVVVSDRTYISSIIAALYVVASLHCLWRTIAIGREGDAARRAAGRIEAGEMNFATEAGNALPDGLIADHIRDWRAKRARKAPAISIKRCCCERWPTGCAVPMALALSPVTR